MAKPFRMKDGRVLTPAMERAAADAFERGLDPARLRSRAVRPGRPRVDEAKGESPRITVRLSPADLRRLREEARRRGMSHTALARERILST